MTLLGPIFYIWRDRTYCVILFSAPLPKNLELKYIALKRDKRSKKGRPDSRNDGVQTIDLSSYLKNKKTAFHIFDNSIYLVFQVEPLFRRKSANGRVSKIELPKGGDVYYNFFVDSQHLIPIDSTSASIARKKQNAEIEGLANLFGPSHVFADKKSIRKWVLGSCNDQFKSSTALPMLKSRALRMVRESKDEPLGICLIGDQIYTDSDNITDRAHEKAARVIKIQLGNIFGIPRFLLSRYSKNFTILDYLSNFILIYGNGFLLAEEYKFPKNLVQKIKRKELGSLFFRLPVVMQWDDHDVIDDWKLDSKWTERSMQPGTKENRKLAEMYPCLILFQAPYLLIENSEREKLANWVKHSVKQHYSVDPRRMKNLRPSEVESVIKNDVSYNHAGNTLLLETRFNRTYKNSRDVKNVIELILPGADIEGGLYSGGGQFSSYKEKQGFFSSYSSVIPALNTLRENSTIKTKNFENLIISTPVFANDRASFFQKRLVKNFDNEPQLLVDQTVHVLSRVAEKMPWFGMPGQAISTLISKLDMEPWDLYDGEVVDFLEAISNLRCTREVTRIIGGDVHYSQEKTVSAEFANGKKRTIKTNSVSSLTENVQPIDVAKKASRFLTGIDSDWREGVPTSENRKIFYRSRKTNKLLVISLFDSDLKSKSVGKNLVRSYVEGLPDLIDQKIQEVSAHISSMKSAVLIAPDIANSEIKPYEDLLRSELAKKQFILNVVGELRSGIYEEGYSYSIKEEENVKRYPNFAEIYQSKLFVPEESK